MSNKKIDELTEKLYAEGLEKGKREAGELSESARKQAESIINEAKKRAESIINEAEKAARETRKNSDAEIKLAARRMISELKQTVESVITYRSIAPNVKAAFEDESFIRSLIETAIKKFNPNKDSNLDLSIVLPETDKMNLAEFVKNKISEGLSGPIEMKIDKSRHGFKIGPGDGSYYLSFTDEDFENLFKSYLRPQVRELLFG